jgi:hypothetical protein
MVCARSQTPYWLRRLESIALLDTTNQESLRRKCDHSTPNCAAGNYDFRAATRLCAASRKSLLGKGLTRLYRHIEVGDAGSQFFRGQEARSDGYRVSPSDERRRDRENWPQPFGLRRKSGHTSLSASTLEPPKPSASASSGPIFARQRTHFYMSIRPRTRPCLPIAPAFQLAHPEQLTKPARQLLFSLRSGSRAEDDLFLIGCSNFLIEPTQILIFIGLRKGHCARQHASDDDLAWIGFGFHHV